jgi:hypothetical protein
MDFSDDGRALAGTAHYCDSGDSDLTVWETNHWKAIREDGSMAEGPLFFTRNAEKLLMGSAVVHAARRGVNSEDFALKDSLLIFRGKDDGHWAAARWKRGSDLFLVKSMSYKNNQDTEGEEVLEVWDVLRRKRVCKWPVLSHGQASYRCSRDGRWLAVWPDEGVRLFRISG